MASSKGYLTFILEQLSDLEGISYRAMMGEYIIYYREKIVGGICDDRLLVKPVKSAVSLMPNAIYELPYDGAKEMLLVDNVDNKDFLTRLFVAMYDELPAQKRRDAIMKITQIKENRRKMILQFSVPSIIAMLLQTVITITDGYFTGNYVGDDALAAINLGLPILYFYLAIGLCIGVGGSVISGRLLGGREKQKASEVFTQTMITTVLICAVISLVLFCFFAPIQGILKADGALTNYFAEYPLLEKYPDIMTQYFEGGKYAVYHFKG